MTEIGLLVSGDFLMGSLFLVGSSFLMGPWFLMGTSFLAGSSFSSSVVSYPLFEAGLNPPSSLSPSWDP